jgi:hypothetical protein
MQHTHVPEPGRFPHSLRAPSLISSPFVGWGVGEAPSNMHSHGVPQQVTIVGFSTVRTHSAAAFEHGRQVAGLEAVEHELVLSDLVVYT